MGTHFLSGSVNMVASQNMGKLCDIYLEVVNGEDMPRPYLKYTACIG